MNEKEIIKLSKLLSLVLRHQPEKIGLTLDENAWVDVNILLEKLNFANVKMDLTLLTYIVENNPKKRFAFSPDKQKIRASQGHSVAVELNYTPQEPPMILFHGTAINFVESIIATGLQKRNRHHVHLSTALETAINVGSRHGKVFVFEVLAKQMFLDGYLFYLSENNVWLTDNVPPKYLQPK